MAPRLTRNSASSREGTEQAENHDNRHEEASDDDQDEAFFDKEGGDGDGKGGSGSSDPDPEQEEDTAEKPKPKKKVAINDKKPVDKRKPIDPFIKENARAAVRFNEDRYNALCPDEERSRGKSTLLRKKSLYHMHHQLKSPKEALADAIAKNTDDEDPELSFELFTEYITQIVEDPKTFDVRLARKVLILDLKQKMEEFTELFIRNSVPCVSYQSLLPSSNIPVSDYLNEDKFTELCNRDPQAMFQEFKLLSIISMARAEQVSGLHRLVSFLNDKLKTVHDWVPALADEYDQEKPGPDTDPAMVQQLKDSLVEKDKIIEGLKDLIADLSIGKGVTRNENKIKAKETVLPSIERDASEAPLRISTCFSTLPPEIDPDDGERSSSHHRSIKQADPARYHN
ncbi:hypothetical protein SMACR_05161 [Sordaria macrospora]|uniref:WGS project CABT00000000 data, contig 2.22 n=2 Tax=Sordaria macrospora TaxID=5147 RepID=F7W2U6_SORMK|nr:uncharacterized protein SMAC_05161 [Sordaria macrospora k-hell]KAA8631817.1 hypothetical protein SMACR_05161 [Sordaria macrospora]KAH7632455.1 hypothetical protein B0T09DRAFT_354593 [Sordaria sp. MPI-SDFR-AT-0083]WPJ61052.1 hypothetical protein SMAC4_05161 [Sordaria macrospora]CCC11947.1 unnamed protein product [Sordaria macrospora k-hell]